MTTATLSDLRYIFFGGGSASEYAFLQAAQAAGIDALDLLNFVTSSTVAGGVSVIGSRFLGFGHSYMTGGGTSHADRQYFTLLSGMLRSDGTDLAKGGSQVGLDESWLGDKGGAGGWAWVLQNHVPYGPTAPDSPEGFIGLLNFGGNDLNQRAHAAGGNALAVFKHGLRTVMSRLASSRVFEDSDASIVYGGPTAWQNPVLSKWRNSGSSHRPIPDNNATFTITIPADFQGGTFAVVVTAHPLSDGIITWTGTVSSVPAPTVLANQSYKDGGVNLLRNSSIGITTRFTGLLASDAGKTIIGTYSGGAGTKFATPAAPGAITQGGAAGATVYGYRRAYRTYNGDTIWSAETQTATGNAALSGANFNTIPAGGAWPAGVEAELIFRSTGPATTGLIAVIRGGPAAVNDIGSANTPYTAITVNPLNGGASVDCCQVECLAPLARGVIVKLNRLVNYGGGTGTDADVPLYNAVIDALVAEFPATQWITVDIDTVLNKSAALFAADGVHPNDKGHALIASAIFTAIASWSTGISTSDISAVSRIAKRITSRNLVVKRYADNPALGDGDWEKSNGVIAAANLPFAGVGTADYTLDATPRLIDITNLLLPINASVGDDLQIDLTALMSAAAQYTYFDIAILDAIGNVSRWISAPEYALTTFSINAGPSPQIVVPNTNVIAGVNGSMFTKVRPSDLITYFSVPGQVVVALGGRTFGATRVLQGGGTFSSAPIALHLRNLGRTNFGFNGS